MGYLTLSSCVEIKGEGLERGVKEREVERKRAGEKEEGRGT